MKPRKQRFDLRRREYDGKIIKWEQKSLSELGILPEPKVVLLSNAPYSKPVPAFDHLVWVVTGVFNHRREAFK